MSSARQSDPGTPPPGGTANQSAAGGSWAPSRVDTSAPRQLEVGGWWRQRVAVTMKLLSALCGLAVAVLLIRPLVKDELTLGPRYITIEPGKASTASKEPAPTPRREEPPPTKPQQAAVAPETPAEEPAEPSAPGKRVEEQRSAFKGALLMLESQPMGATVRVNGVNQGETPVTVGLDCMPGSTLVIVYAMRGFESTTHRTPCPRDALVTVKAQLRKGSGKTGKAAGKR